MTFPVTTLSASTAMPKPRLAVLAQEQVADQIALDDREPSPFGEVVDRAAGGISVANFAKGEGSRSSRAI